MSENKKVLQIDVKKVIAGKSPRIADRIPAFIYRWAKNFIHQDELNDIMMRNRDCEGPDFATAVLHDLNVTYRIHSKYTLDKNKKYIFASNHPLGGLDGIILISYIGKEFHGVKAVVNDLLMYITPLQSTFIPINKYGKMKQENAELIHQAFESDSQMLFFPAGICSRLIDGKVQDTEWKKTFVSKAIEYGRDIIPVYFEGANSRIFYRMEKVRKKLGIKFNFGAICLPDEMFKQKNATFDVYFGEPVSYLELKQKESIKGWAKILRDSCYKLKDQYGTDSKTR